MYLKDWRMKRQKPSPKGDEAIVVCENCGREYLFESFEALSRTARTTRCECGHYYIREMEEKLEKIMDLMATDKHAQELIKAGKTEEFVRYFKKDMA